MGMFGLFVFLARHGKYDWTDAVPCAINVA